MPRNRLGNIKFGYIIAVAVLFFCMNWQGRTAYCADSYDETCSTDSRSESELRDELWDLVKSLRQLRTDYYEKKTEYSKKIKKYQTTCSKLEAELDKLRERSENLDKNIADADKEISKLQKEKQKNDQVESSVVKKLLSFVSRQTEIVDKGIPYRREDRLERLNGKASANDQQISDLLGRVWSFSQEELRIARSGESYTGQVQTDKGRLQYARLFRVGHLVLGYITEQGGKAGLWDNEKQEWKTSAKTDSIIQSIDILDRKRPAELTRMPVFVNPKHIKTEGDKAND